jgi:hypothetical protein
VLEVGELLWRDNAVCEITIMNADSACVRVLDMLVCDYTAPASVHAFVGHDKSSILYTDTPLRIDTAEVNSHGVVYFSRSEVSMLCGVELEVAAATNSSACESPHSASSDDDSSNRANSAIFKVRNFACFCGSKYVPSM